MATNTAREELTKRKLLQMTLSNGTPKSMTAPTQPLPDEMTAEQKALARFAVHGNAIREADLSRAQPALLEHGASGLALLDIQGLEENAKIDRLRSDFPNAKILARQLNVTSGSWVIGQVFEAVVEELGSIDIMVSFAGIVGVVHAMEITEQEFRRTLDVNTTGTFLCAQAAGRIMRRQGRGGCIVFIASISAHRVNFPQPQVAYNISKTAVLSMAHSLAAEWARYGIRVNTLSPGYMDTILNEGEGNSIGRKIWAERNPFGRMGSPPELTGPLVMLCSKFASAYITGTDLVIDGGGTVF
ncbi:MAG: hypothetical protein Q9162_004688 [Coniocarpon cinnabarinum]